MADVNKPERFELHLAANVEAGHIHTWVPVRHYMARGVTMQFLSCRCGQQRNHYYV